MKKSQMHFRVSEEEKKIIDTLAIENGYKTTSAFLLASAKKHTVFNVNMAGLFELSKEVNYIGHNINTLIKKIYSYDFYTESDIESLKNKMEMVEYLLQGQFEELKRISKNLKNKDIDFLDLLPFIQEFQMKKTNALDFNFEVIDRLEKIFVFVESIIVYDLDDEDRLELFSDLIDVDILFSLEQEVLISFEKELYTVYKKIKLLSALKKYDDIHVELLAYANVIRKYLS